MINEVTIIGDGAMATVSAILLSSKGLGVRLWGAFPVYVAAMRRRRENVKFLPGIPLPDELELSADLGEAVADADVLVAAVPTQFVRRVLRRLARCTPRGVPVVSVAKGIENRTLLRPTQIVADVLGRVPLVALSGPSHAEETARKIGVPFMGRLPIDPEIARLCDAGRVEEYPVDAFAGIAKELAERTPAARPAMFLNI